MLLAAEEGHQAVFTSPHYSDLQPIERYKMCTVDL